MKSRLLLVTLCGITVGVLPYLADAAHSRLYPGLVEYLWVPGLLLASFAYPQGVHTGTGTPEFVPVAVLMNVLFYCGVTWLTMRVYSHLMSRSGSRGSRK